MKLLSRTQLSNPKQYEVLVALFGLAACNKLVNDDIATAIAILMQVLMLIQKCPFFCLCDLSFYRYVQIITSERPCLMAHISVTDCWILNLKYIRNQQINPY